MHKQQKKTILLEVTEFSKDGHGLGFYFAENGNQSQVEVPLTIPGDRVQAELLRKRSGVYQARLDAVIHSSPQRIQPKCSHFGVCGGCRWQQQSYEQQLHQKEKWVRQCFDSHKGNIDSIVPCDPPWHYRNKMEFSFNSNAAKEKFLGLVIGGSRGKVVNLSECHLVQPWFTQAITAVRGWWEDSGLEAYHPHRNTGTLRTLTLREGQRTGDRMVVLTVSGDLIPSVPQELLDKFVVTLRSTIEPSVGALSIFLRTQHTCKGMKTQFCEVHLYGPKAIREYLYLLDKTLLFDISPSAFFQPNTKQAEKIYTLALETVSGLENKIVYDLYCGTGTLSLCAALSAKQVIGIELSSEAVVNAISNAKLNHLENVTFLQGDAGKILAQINEKSSYPNPDIVMVDPPRAGLGPEAIEEVLRINPLTILYISCNPVSQAQDISHFVEKGYEIKRIQPVDQFPHTVHVENIVLLKR